MNPRELLARLNVPAIRYEVGRGGISQLTNLDIAAALGFISDEFDCELVSLIWWSDSYALLNQKVSRQFNAMLMTEYSRRHREATAAKLEQHMVECELEARRSKKESDLKIVAEYRRKAIQAGDKVWTCTEENDSAFTHWMEIPRAAHDFEREDI